VDEGEVYGEEAFFLVDELLFLVVLHLYAVDA
jgi:hypothetical protein